MGRCRNGPPRALSSGLPTGRNSVWFRRLQVCSPTVTSYEAWVAFASVSAFGWVQVWLEAGREGQVFTYANPRSLPLAIGDLVQVRLQGRRHGGLVVDLLDTPPVDLGLRSLQPVELRLQPAAVDAEWQALITAVAAQCHTSVFRTLKSALPAGWLGQRRQSSPARERPQWLVRAACADLPSRLSAGQRALLLHLQAAPAAVPLRQLCGQGGFSRYTVASLERRQLLVREQGPAPGGRPCRRIPLAGPRRRAPSPPPRGRPWPPSRRRRRAAHFCSGVRPARERTRCTCRPPPAAWPPAAAPCCWHRRSA